MVKGSQAVKQETNTVPSYVTTLRKDLLEQGVLITNDSHFSFTQDQVFTSPSTASAVVKGGSANGRDDWKSKSGKTLKQIQESASGLKDKSNE